MPFDLTSQVLVPNLEGEQPDLIPTLEDIIEIREEINPDKISPFVGHKDIVKATFSRLSDSRRKSVYLYSRLPGTGKTTLLDKIILPTIIGEKDPEEFSEVYDKQTIEYMKRAQLRHTSEEDSEVIITAPNFGSTPQINFIPFNSKKRGLEVKKSLDSMLGDLKSHLALFPQKHLSSFEIEMDENDYKAYVESKIRSLKKRIYSTLGSSPDLQFLSQKEGDVGFRVKIDSNRSTRAKPDSFFQTPFTSHIRIGVDFYSRKDDGEIDLAHLNRELSKGFLSNSVGRLSASQSIEQLSEQMSKKEVKKIVFEEQIEQDTFFDLGNVRVLRNGDSGINSDNSLKADHLSLEERIGKVKEIVNRIESEEREYIENGSNTDSTFSDLSGIHVVGTEKSHKIRLRQDIVNSFYEGLESIFERYQEIPELTEVVENARTHFDSQKESYLLEMDEIQSFLVDKLKQERKKLNQQKARQSRSRKGGADTKNLEASLESFFGDSKRTIMKENQDIIRIPILVGGNSYSSSRYLQAFADSSPGSQNQRYSMLSRISSMRDVESFMVIERNPDKSLQNPSTALDDKPKTPNEATLTRAISREPPHLRYAPGMGFFSKILVVPEKGQDFIKLLDGEGNVNTSDANQMSAFYLDLMESGGGQFMLQDGTIVKCSGDYTFLLLANENVVEDIVEVDGEIRTSRKHPWGQRSLVMGIEDFWKNSEETQRAVVEYITSSVGEMEISDEAVHFLLSYQIGDQTRIPSSLRGLDTLLSKSIETVLGEERKRIEISDLERSLTSEITSTNRGTNIVTIDDADNRITTRNSPYRLNFREGNERGILSFETRYIDEVEAIVPVIYNFTNNGSKEGSVSSKGDRMKVSKDLKSYAITLDGVLTDLDMDKIGISSGKPMGDRIIGLTPSSRKTLSLPPDEDKVKPDIALAGVLGILSKLKKVELNPGLVSVVGGFNSELELIGGEFMYESLEFIDKLGESVELGNNPYCILPANSMYTLSRKLRVNPLSLDSSVRFVGVDTIDQAFYLATQNSRNLDEIVNSETFVDDSKRYIREILEK